MLKFCENLIRNNAKKNILNDPTEEMKLETV